MDIEIVDLSSGSDDFPKPSVSKKVEDIDFVGSLLHSTPTPTFEVSLLSDDSNDEIVPSTPLPPSRESLTEDEGRRLNGATSVSPIEYLVDEKFSIHSEPLSPQWDAVDEEITNNIGLASKESCNTPSVFPDINTEGDGIAGTSCGGVKRKRNEVDNKGETVQKDGRTLYSKNLKPGECIKYMIMELSNDLMYNEWVGEVLDVIGKAGVSVVGAAPPHPKSCIMWSRRKYTNNNIGQLGISVDGVREPGTVVIMAIEEMVHLVEHRALNNHMEQILQVDREYHTQPSVTIVLLGWNTYFKNVKSHQNRQWKKDVQGISSDAPRRLVTENDLEYYLTKLLFEKSISVSRAENPEGLGRILMQFTKAIAEAPFKKEKHAMDMEANFYMRGDNRDTVKVDKQGVGLLRLWSQSITKFPLAGLDIAQALCQRFPSPASLMQELEGSESSSIISMLSDIPVRRAAGPLAATKRLGPELAKKLFTYYTATDGNQLLA